MGRKAAKCKQDKTGRLRVTLELGEAEAKMLEDVIAHARHWTVKEPSVSRAIREAIRYYHAHFRSAIDH